MEEKEAKTRIILMICMALLILFLIGVIAGIAIGINIK